MSVKLRSLSLGALATSFVAAATLAAPATVASAVARPMGHSPMGHSTTSAGPAGGSSTSPRALLGVTDGWGFSRDLAAFGKLPVVHVYFRGAPSARATAHWAGVAQAVVVSFGGSTSAVTSGREDGALRQFFTTRYRSGTKIYYNYIKEPDHALKHRGLSLSGYRSAWAHIQRLAAAAHNSAMISTVILTAWDLKSGYNWRQFLVPGTRALGWDTYPGILGRTMQAPAQFIGPAIAACRSVKLTCGIGEVGLQRMPGRPGWLTSLGNWLRTSGMAWAAYFNAPKVVTFALTDHASASAWRAQMQAGG